MHRWEEEVELTLEEMHCVLCFMNWHVHHWRSLISKHQVLDATLQEGIAAYGGLKNCCNVWTFWIDCDAVLDSMEITPSTGGVE